MDTTIQVSKELVNFLNKRKLHSREKYEEVIWDLIEDTQELSEETKKEIEEGRKQVKEGKVVSLNDLKKKYNIK